MSMNLSLYDPVSGCDYNLYQTPTEDTYYILEGGTREAIGLEKAGIFTLRMLIPH